MCKKTIREKVAEQVGIIHEMQSAGFNIVECGSCGSINLHRTPTEEIECAYCHFISDPCDFPDYLYSGVENSSQFDEVFTWEYSVSTNSIWSSFDCGEVEAENYHMAYKLALAKLEEDFSKVNEVLQSNGLGTIEFDRDGIELTKKE